jgi:hypothetical protein
MLINRETEMRSAYDMDIAGGDILYLAVFGLVYFIMIFVIEFMKSKGTLEKYFSHESSIKYVPK